MYVIDRFAFHNYDAIDWDALVKDDLAVKCTIQSALNNGSNPYLDWWKRMVKDAEKETEKATVRLLLR